MFDVLIIGCGVIGAACAYELGKYDLSVCVLEKSNDVANGTSKANSAIIHAGYDPHCKTGMARLNVLGNRLMPELCRKLDVPYRKIGSHVLAFSEEELQTLRTLYQRGVQNGVENMRILSAKEVLAMEPQLSDQVLGSLWAPDAGVVSPWELTLALIETAIRNGAELHLSSEVTALQKTEKGFRVQTGAGAYEAKVVLNAAGLFAGAIQKMAGEPPCPVQPNRGEYYLLDKSEGGRVHSVIFQCPNQNGKGVLIAPTVHGNLLVGPNAENTGSAEDTGNTAQALQFVQRMALRSVPTLNFRENIRNFAGIRANHASDDFLIGESPLHPGLYHLAGIKSPGLSSAPAIALDAARYVCERLNAQKKQTYCDSRSVIRFRMLSDEQKQALIAHDASYGRIICRCETITEGEILAALRSPVPPTSLNAVKRRVGAGMGRCQGSFCSPRVQELLSAELGVAMKDVLLDEEGSYILSGALREENGKPDL